MVRTGSTSASPTPNSPSDGPAARIKTFFGDVPPTTSPAMSMPLPLPTTPRVEILARIVSGEVASGVTANNAGVLDTTPPGPRTVTQYVPASAGCTEPMV